MQSDETEMDFVAESYLVGGQDDDIKTEDEVAQSIHRGFHISPDQEHERNNLVYLPSRWLHKGKQVLKIAQAVLIKRHTDGSYKGRYVQIQIWNRLRGSQFFKREKDITLDEKPLQELLIYLRQTEISLDEENNTYVMLPPAAVLDNLDEIERQTFANILGDLVRSRRVIDLFTMGQLNIETINHLAAAALQVKYKAALQELREMVEGTGPLDANTGRVKLLKEADYQVWFEDHTWIFGTEYIRRIDIRTIDTHASVDLILETADGFFDVLELKTPEAVVLKFDRSHQTWYFSTDVAKVIAQGVKYLKAIDRNADRIEVDSAGNIRLIRPRVRIVIGRSIDWTREQHEAFRRLGATLHNIDLITFDHVIQRAVLLVNRYESSLELETVKLDPS